MEAWVYMVEQFVVVGIFQSAFVGAREGCSEGREDDYIVRMLLEDVAEALLDDFA